MAHAPLAIGQRVIGLYIDWEVVRELAHGGRGHAFVVKALAARADTELPSSECVLKTVHLDPGRSPDEVAHRAASVHEQLQREFLALKRLRDLDCVPEVFDFGQFLFKLHPQNTLVEEPIPLSFLVQEFIHGQRLDAYLVERFGVRSETVPNAREFRGIPSARDWFELGRLLASSLLQIQLRETVHRDIWHENILVQDSMPVFIDFGDAYSRLEVAVYSSNTRDDPYVAPEIRLGSRWPSRRSDIYSMGGVLLYMATGEHPPNPPVIDDEQLKQRIENDLARRNPDLLNTNHGVADIIARCLRSDHHKRILDAEMLLEELRLFDIDLERPSLEASLDELRRTVGVKEGCRILGLFQEIAATEIRHLTNVLNGMELGSVDINGDHERLAAGLTHYMSVLGRGDEYLAVSTADFWGGENAGLNGRLLSMNRVLAQRGVTIRRLFFVTKEELHDPSSYFHRVAREHVRKQQNLDADVRWETFVKVVDERKKDDAIDFFHHFGVWIKNEQVVKVLPVYTRLAHGERRLRSVRIRKYDGTADSIRREFNKSLKDAQNLKDTIGLSFDSSS